MRGPLGTTRLCFAAPGNPEAATIELTASVKANVCNVGGSCRYHVDPFYRPLPPTLGQAGRVLAILIPAVDSARAATVGIGEKGTCRCHLTPNRSFIPGMSNVGRLSPRALQKSPTLYASKETSGMRRWLSGASALSCPVFTFGNWEGCA